MSMTENGYFLPVQITPLPGRSISKWGKYEITGNCIFKEEHIPELCVGVTSLDQKSKGNGKVLLSQLSPLHARSFAVEVGGGPFAFEDEFGNVFSAFDIKGNYYGNLDMHALESVYGLDDTERLDVILENSYALRSIGIDTEMITRVIVPEKVPFKGRLVTQDEFRELFFQQVCEKLEMGRIQPYHLHTVKRYLSNAEFVHTLRATQVHGRLLDLHSLTARADRDQLLRPTFQFINFQERKKQKKDPSYRPVAFSPDSPSDIEAYFLEYLPEKLGGQVFAMHNSGRVHMNLHPGNINLAGGIVDLGTVTNFDGGYPKYAAKDELERVERGYQGIIERVFQRPYVGDKARTVLTTAYNKAA